MNKSTIVEAQTLNDATPNGIDLRKISLNASDVFINVIRNLESILFKDYVMCYPEKFKDAIKGINNYVESCVSSEIRHLNLPKEEADYVQCTATSIISAYILEKYIVEMVEGYRDEALENENQYEDEIYNFNQDSQELY